MIKLSEVKFGTDAEFFLRTKAGQPFPVTGLIGGDKANPIPIPGILAPGFAMQEDNAALEFNIPAGHAPGQIYESIRLALEFLRKKIPSSLEIDQEYCSLVFNEKYLSIPELRRFGCEPDYNAWTMTTNERPMPRFSGQRTAAAHMHIGWPEPIDDDRLELIRLSDVFVVLPTILHQPQDEKDRRMMYGKAGAFRFKEYGTEHRVLSNKWLKNWPSFMTTMNHYYKAILALNFGIKVEKDDYKRVVAAIDNSHEKLSILLREKYMKILREHISPREESQMLLDNGLADF